MRKILLLLLAWFVVSGGISYAQRTAVNITPQKQNKVAQDIKQNVPLRKCGTMEYLAKMEAENPSLFQSRLELEQFTENWIKNNQEYLNNANKAVVTVPVVVHVVGTSTVQNAITATRVNEQINVLNRDYAGQNTHSMGSFATSLKANTELQFCLAQRKPDGTATNGINYVTTTTSSYSTNNLMKTHAPAWDPTKYMNIWVCNLGNSLCGYAQFPSSGINSTFGVVIHYQFFGVTGATAPYNQGGTTTHEIGHCFNLYHIWGDDGGACNGTDYCNDTPNQADANYNQWTGVHTDACTTTSPGIMYMNFMDYSPDVTYANFTPNQGARIQALFASGGALYSMTQNNLGCVPPGGSSVPTVTTTAASNITATGATTGGNVTADGGATVTARGVCYATTQNPTTTNSTVASGSGTGTFTANITGLTSGTTYYARAYATNSNGTAYGNQISFTPGGGTTTGCDTTSLMTSNLLWYSFANGNNNYGDLAKANYFANTTSGQTIQDVAVQFIYAKGTTGTATVAVWNGAGATPGATPLATQTVTLSTIGSDVTAQQPTLVHFSSPVTLSGPCFVGVILPTAAGDTAVVLADTSADANYNVAWEKWSDNTWYPYDDAQSWGIEAALAVFPVICSSGSTTQAPTVSTTAASAITNTTATSGGNVTADGGAAVTARGICYATTQNPTTSNTVVNSGTGTGTFTSNLTGLTAGTTYYVRAFATNSVGTSYGNQITFTTTGGQTTTGCDTISLMTSNLLWYSFANGNNNYGDLAKANYFASTTNGQTIQDVAVQFIYAKGTTGTATVAVWNGAGATPGATPLATQTVTLSTIGSDVTAQQPTWVHFSSPVTLSGPCFVGVILPTAAGDTAVVLADTSADANYNVAWEKWSDNTWYPYDDAQSWGIEAALAVFPVICSSSTGEQTVLNNQEISIFPNPSSSNVYINLGKFNNEAVTIFIYDALGKQIDVHKNVSNGLINCNFSNRSAGLYFIHVNTPEGNIVKKISINK